MYNILDQKELDVLKETEPQRFQYLAVGSAIFESEDIEKTIREFKSILTKSFL